MAIDKRKQLKILTENCNIVKNVVTFQKKCSVKTDPSLYFEAATTTKELLNLTCDSDNNINFQNIHLKPYGNIYLLLTL